MVPSSGTFHVPDLGPRPGEGAQLYALCQFLPLHQSIIADVLLFLS